MLISKYPSTWYVPIVALDVINLALVTGLTYLASRLVNSWVPTYVALTALAALRALPLVSNYLVATGYESPIPKFCEVVQKLLTFPNH